jgi:hypothetical protein
MVCAHAVRSPAAGPAAVMGAGAFPPCVLSAQESHNPAVAAGAAFLHLCCRPVGEEAKCSAITILHGWVVMW